MKKEKNINSSNKALFTNKKKHENLIKRALIDKAKAVVYLENDMGNIAVDVDTLEYEVIFDDSIVQDDESILVNMKEDSLSGFVPMWRYVAKRYQLTEEEAKQWVAERQQEQDNAFIDFVDTVEEEPEIEPEE